VTINCDGERCTVQGAITIDNVTAVLEESARTFVAPRLIIDLSGVSEVDSTALSLLLEWRRSAAAAQRVIAFTNLPANLRSLADLYGVSELLGAA
jgi:phospholipid transport system transporter-binding protein